MENKNAVIRPLALAVALSFVGGASAVGTGTVVSGSGNIIKNGNQVNVQQNTDKMIVNWNNMNVGKNENLNFKQPNANAAVLNKINSIDPTVIAGALNANGKVFIVNPNGVLISKGSSINVGSLIASSLDISNKDFINGNINLKGTGKGKVVNEGNINAADAVAMLGAGEVTNNGTIRTQSGGAALASGSDITLYFPEMGKMSVKVNKGSLNALINNGGIIVSDRGNVTLTAWATDTLTRGVINNTGVLEARGFQNILDGGVSLSTNGDVNLGGRVNAHYARRIEAVGKNVNVSDGTELSAESTILSSTHENGYVKVGRIESKRGTTAISADNVLTTAAGNQSEFSSDVKVYARTPGKNIDIADTSVKTENQIRNEKGVVSAGLIEAVAKSGNSLGIQNDEGHINVNNAEVDYGNLTLNSDKAVNINGQMKGDSLQVNARQINQSVGAKINMKNRAQLYTTSDLKQNADIVSDHITISSGASILQNKDASNIAKEINYWGKDIKLSGNTQADSLAMYTVNNATESASASISAAKLDLNGADYDFSAGKNRIDVVHADLGSLSLSNTEDISLDNGSYITGDLNLNGDKNVSLLHNSHVLGNSNITAAEDVILKGAFTADKDIKISGNNILSKSQWEDDMNMLTTYGNMTLHAKKDIDLPFIEVGGKLKSNAKPNNENKNNLNVTAENISLGQLYVKGNAHLNTIGEPSAITGNITLGASDIMGNANVKTQGDITLTKRMVAGGDINMESNNLLSGSSLGEYWWIPQDRSSIQGRNVNLQVKNDINLGGVITNFDGFYSKNGNALITAKNVTLDSLWTMSDVKITAKDNVSIKAFDPMYMSFPGSTNSPTVRAEINADSVNIDSSSASVNVAVTANNDIHYGKSINKQGTTLTSKNGSVYLGERNIFDDYDYASHKSLTINAAKKAAINNNLNVSGKLSVTAGKPGISLPSELTVMGDTVFTTPGNISTDAYYTEHTFYGNLTYILGNYSYISAYNRYFQPSVYGKKTIIRK